MTVSDHSRSGHRTDQARGPARLGPGGRGADQPDRVVFADGSDEEYARLCEQLVDGRHLQAARRREEAELVSGAAPTRPTWRGSKSRTFICSEREIDAGPTNNWMDPAEMRGDHDRPVPRLHARPHHVRGPVLHGPARRRGPEARRGDHRLRVRRRVDADHDPDGQGGAGQDGRRRLLRQGAALDRRPAGAGPGGRAVAVQRHQVHHATSRRPARSGATAPATAATRCWARSATRCASPRRWPTTRAGSPSTC